MLLADHDWVTGWIVTARALHDAASKFTSCSCAPKIVWNPSRLTRSGNAR